MDDKKNGILERLKHSVQLLASPAEVQLGLLPAFVCKPDELALEFDHWWEVTRSNYGAILSADEQSALIAIQQKLTWLTQNAKQEWTDEAVTNSPHWQEIRDLALRALNAFGWPMEVPPSYSSEYVSEHRFRRHSHN